MQSYRNHGTPSGVTSLDDLPVGTPLPPTPEIPCFDGDRDNSAQTYDNEGAYGQNPEPQGVTSAILGDSQGESASFVATVAG